jgi:iron complex outermembrane receptor protein
VLQKRDRLSYAILHKFAAEYRGEFFDRKLTVNLGASLPFFIRNLNNYCATSSAGGFVECTGQNAAIDTQLTTLNPYTFNATTNTVTGFSPAQSRRLTYRKFLPSVGLVLKPIDNISLFANYSKNISVPGTDSLYNSFFYPVGTSQATPVAETTDNYDVGVRYRSGMIQGELSGFYNQYKNRLATAYDPVLDVQVIRNLGSVKKYGVDGYISIQPVPQLQFYAFGSYLKSEIRDNIQIGTNSDGTPIFALTAGKRESGAPVSTLGFSGRATFGAFQVGLLAKRTGPRFIYDTNEATFTGSFIPAGAKTSTGGAPVTPVAPVQIYGAKAPAYWLASLDARMNLSVIGLNDKSFIQLNVYNLFNQFYVGGVSSGLNQATTGAYNKATGLSVYGNPGFAQIGAPRTISGSVVFAF